MMKIQDCARGFLLLSALSALLIASALPSAAANIVVVNGDGVNEGFNDTTPWTPRGGNPANTLGQARLNAFQRAADLWGDLLVSNVTIEVRAKMDPLTCTPTGAVLGSAGATSIHRSFAGAPLSNTWYPQALANSLRGADLNVGTADIQATFNSSLNGGSCLNGAEWYYGYDASPPGRFFCQELAGGSAAACAAWLRILGSGARPIG